METLCCPCGVGRIKCWCGHKMRWDSKAKTHKVNFFWDGTDIDRSTQNIYTNKRKTVAHYTEVWSKRVTYKNVLNILIEVRKKESSALDYKMKNEYDVSASKDWKNKRVEINFVGCYNITFFYNI